MVYHYIIFCYIFEVIYLNVCYTRHIVYRYGGIFMVIGVIGAFDEEVEKFIEMFQLKKEDNTRY